MDSNFWKYGYINKSTKCRCILYVQLFINDSSYKDIFKKGEGIARDEVINLSQELGLNIITGSDSHTPVQLGGIYTSLNKECKTIKELKECIKNNDYTIEINSALNFKIFSSKILKRYLLKADTYDKNTEFKI